MDTQAGAQFATNSQTTIDLQAGIIASHQDEIGRANVRITDQAAEIERLKIVVADRNAKVAELMGAVARAEIDADETALLKRQIHNLKRHIAEYCPAAPSEQAEATGNPRDWLMDGSLLYRLSDKGANCDEINVTMVHGSRGTLEREAAAAGLLCLICAADCGAAAPAAPLPDQPDLSKLTRLGWSEAYIGETSDLVDDANGTYVRFVDVEALFSAQQQSGSIRPSAEPAGALNPVAYWDKAVGGFYIDGEQLPPAIRARATPLYDAPAGAAPLPELTGPSAPTDISKRLRECANAPMANQDHAKLMLTAADECERFYGGMVAWKETAQAKDRVNVETYAHKIAAAKDRALDEAVGAIRYLGEDSDEIFAASAIEAISALKSAASPSLAPAPTEIGDDVFYPPKAVLKREDWDAKTHKPKVEPRDSLVLPLVAAPVSQQESTQSDYALVRAVAKDLFNKSFADPEVTISSASLAKRNAVQTAVEVFQAAMKATPTPGEQSSIPGAARQGGDTKPSDAESSPASRMGGITSKESGETAEQQDPDDSGPPCATCGGHGVVGRFVPNESAPGYDDHPCPDCESAETAAPGASGEDKQ